MIIDLLKTEYLKFKKNSTVTILLAFYFIFLPFSIFLGSELKDSIPAFISNKNAFFVFPSTWDYMGYAGSWLVFFFLGVAIIYMTCNEIAYKTLRQGIINGYTRIDFFVAKFSTLVLLAVIATLYYAIITSILGYFNTEDLTLAVYLENISAVARYFLMCMGYFSLALLFAFVLRKSGLAIFLYLSYVIIIEPIIRGGYTYSIGNKYVNYFPMNATEDLMPLPLWRFAEALPQGKQDMDFEFLLSYPTATTLTIIYSIIFLGLAYFSFMKKDI